MIFDSVKMQKLREEFKEIHRLDVPQIIHYDFVHDYDGEKAEIETLASTLTRKKFRKWLGNFLAIEDNQHLGAWFEIMLFGWLKDKFTVEFEPAINGNHPDFKILNNQNPIIVEARAFGYNNNERAKKNNSKFVFSILERIQKPYSVKIELRSCGTEIDEYIFIDEVNRRLDSLGGTAFTFIDNFGNNFYISADYNPNFSHVMVIATQGLWTNGDRLKSLLLEKAQQHQKLRDEGFPYVIAIYLEPAAYSYEEVISAWYGNPIVTIYPEIGQLIEKNDYSGILFSSGVDCQTVSGILVFRSLYDEVLKKRILRCGYIENSLAKIKIDPHLFRAESRFLVTEKLGSTYTMNWVG